MSLKFKKKIEGSVGSTNGFWYDLTAGGYFKPEEVISDAKSLKKVEDAISILQELEAKYDEHHIEN